MSTSLHEPITWQLHEKTPEQLLAIVEQRAWRHHLKSKRHGRIATLFGRKLNKYGRSKFYADWYALEAARELRRKLNV